MESLNAILGTANEANIALALWAIVASFALAFSIGRSAVLGRKKPPTVPRGVVDPWELQRELMRMSDQPLPTSPVMGKGSLLYLALILEELAELVCANIKVLERSGAASANMSELGYFHRDEVFCAEVRAILRPAQYSADVASRRIRAYLSGPNHYWDGVALTPAEAEELADGTTDVSVVNCGFALASGLPGADCYLEVLGSNLSKANPITGAIDKHPDGKWIKGRDYRKPDLARVLSQVGVSPN